ncbi:hypothetical protein Q4S30_03305, partial [Morganella morganii]
MKTLILLLLLLLSIIPLVIFKISIQSRGLLIFLFYSLSLLSLPYFFLKKKHKDITGLLSFGIIHIIGKYTFLYVVSIYFDEYEFILVVLIRLFVSLKLIRVINVYVFFLFIGVLFSLLIDFNGVFHIFVVILICMLDMTLLFFIPYLSNQSNCYRGLIISISLSSLLSLPLLFVMVLYIDTDMLISNIPFDLHAIIGAIMFAIFYLSSIVALVAL